ncbi:MAG: [protein-PII] uridylyltransferase [Proteobacteria bacterium]|nr:[protein-PII] uridylyltransferase [Pseudomonadota bacterium]
MRPDCEDYFRGVSSHGAPGSMNLNPNVRAYLDAARDYLLQRHDRSVPARELNEQHAEMIDRLVRKLFRLASDPFLADDPKLGTRLAVIAVGGYGRRELSFGSDIDLLFLYRGKPSVYVETVAEAVTQRLWDARLVVGHATRNIAESMRMGREDLPTLTSYLDARFLIGDPGLFAEFDRETSAYIRRHPRAFVDGKLAEQHGRHVRKGESPYLLQPDLKDGVGGLRDYHTALWLARALLWDVKRAEHLRRHGLVDAEEEAELLQALDFLWRLRNQLQRKGRKEDRLSYEIQPELAEFMGLSDTPELLAVEQLMREYYLHARCVQRVSQNSASRTLERLDRRRERRSKPSYPVAEGFAIADGRLEIPRAEMLAERPLRLLSVFAVAQHHDVELSLRAQGYVRQHVHRIDDALRSDPAAADVFRQILDSPLRVYRTLGLMNELGVLAAYLPEFAHLVGLWQQNLYHTYTVDVHSLFLVEQLRRTWKGENRETLPLATELIREVRRPFVLYLSCILHDIGKGRGGGHCQRGAVQVPGIAARLGLSSEEAEMVEFLVLHHLTKSGMADRRDVNDSRTIQNLATLCRTRERLRMLYLITVADIRSVSSEAWTAWKRSQMIALYRNTMEWLETGAEAESATQFFIERAMRRAQQTQGTALELIAARDIDVSEAELLLDVMPRRYILDHTPMEIASHLQAALSFLAAGGEVGVHPFWPDDGSRGFWGLVVLARDRPGLFSAVAGVLAGCGHDILRAQVYTTRDGLALEIYQVRPPAGGAPEAELERARIESRLIETLKDGTPPPIRRQLRERPPEGAVRRRAPAVRISNEESDFYTVVDVSTNDRPALLYDITRALTGLGLEIGISRASTHADRATDAFYVTRDGRRVTDPGPLGEIDAALRSAIGDTPERAG